MTLTPVAPVVVPADQCMSPAGYQYTLDRTLLPGRHYKVAIKVISPVPGLHLGCQSAILRDEAGDLFQVCFDPRHDDGKYCKLFKIVATDNLKEESESEQSAKSDQ